MTSNELFEKMQSTWDMLVAEHNGKGKAAQGRARKLASELKKLASEYKKVSVAEAKTK
jgi:hypothetical protein